jgi:Cdc6-like AAA superfamily ATPase
MESKTEKLEILNEVFHPRQPITSKDLFFGRMQQADDIVDAVSEPGQHVVLYGERGVGKTSLANVIEERYSGAITSKFSCSSSHTFKKIWQGIFNRILVIQEKDGVGFIPHKVTSHLQLDMFLSKDEHDIDYNDILNVLERLKEPVLFIFDEFDNVDANSVRSQFADTIKALSDNAPNVTVVIVGVSDNVSDLIGHHPSLARCLKQVRLPLMSPDELIQIIRYGIRAIGIDINAVVEKDIVEFSQGFPHYTHLLSKYAARSAILRDSNKIERGDFLVAIDSAIEDAHESIRSSYEKAVMTRKDDAIYKEVLYACANTKIDENGTFKATDIQRSLSEILRRDVKLQSYSYHLGTLCQTERGAILQRVGSKNNFRYKFKNPLLKAFVTLKHYQSKQ